MQLLNMTLLAFIIVLTAATVISRSIDRTYITYVTFIIMM